MDGRAQSGLAESSMRAPQIESAEPLPTLIFADQISGDERRSAFLEFARLPELRQLSCAV
jgi:hypothetical protein